MTPLMSGMMGADTVGEQNEDGAADNLASMMTMLGSFTILRLTNLLGAGSVQVTKEQLLELNDKLNKIPYAAETLA